jgi:hypothetical protein
LLERRPRFLEVPGLLQKSYGQDSATGDVCGIYFFEDQAALTAFRETGLAKTIPSAYEAVEVRREVCDVLYPLRAERGPFEGWLTRAGRRAVAPIAPRLPGAHRERRSRRRS